MDKNVLAPRAHPIFDLSLFAVPERNPGPNAARIASSLRVVRNKLLGMQQTAAEFSAHDPSFASFLASLAAPPQPAGPEWNDDQLGDDVATLSYEQALRTHGQYRPPASDQGPAPGSESGQSRPDRTPSASPDRSLKRASITIRLTEPECAQLRRRAAEAGITVSAYLRSCALEVESLRTQVKGTLAHLRESTPVPAPTLPSRQKPWFHFWSFGRRMGIGGRAA
jgi:hypothetical protein